MNSAQREMAGLAQECVVHFTCLFDAKDYEAMERHFAPDGVWIRAEGTLRGLDQLRANLRSRSHRLNVRHLLTNLRATMTSDRECIVESYFLVFRWESDIGEAPGGMRKPALLGRYRDQVGLYDGTWKLKFRQALVDLDSRVDEPTP